jgi:hypothetical protein
MQSLRLDLAVAVCSILLGACLLTAKTSPVPTASFGEAENEVGNTRSAEEKDREYFGILVKEVKFYERAATRMENTAKCPYKTLSFDGVTHVMCDYRQCHDPALCRQRCHQVFAYLDPHTRIITKDEPGGIYMYENLYIGCIYEEKTGKQSKETTPLV